MTGYKSKKDAALDEDGMYLVHQTDHQGKHMTKDKTLKLALEVNESMKDVLKQVNELIAENKALKEALAQLEQRKPLTVEEVKKLIHPILMADLSDEMTDFEIVRAIEAAHGIKEENNAA